MLEEKIRTRRKARGLSQQELADRLHVVRQTVSKWENGLSVPDAGMLVRIAGALDTTVNDLLGEEEPEQGRDLAAELEALNRQLAERAERSRRRWRAFFAAVGILALCGAVMLAAGLIRQLPAVQLLSGAPVIGGADRATGIWVVRPSGPWLPLLLTAGAGLAAVAGLWKTRKK